MGSSIVSTSVSNIIDLAIDMNMMDREETIVKQNLEFLPKIPELPVSDIRILYRL